jgi:hypothetical protein
MERNEARRVPQKPYQGTTNKNLKVLTQDQINEFNEQGFIIIPNAVSAEECDRCYQEIWEMVEQNSPARQNDPATWDGQPFDTKGFLDTFPIHHLQTIWNMRQDPKIYNYFVDILGKEELLVSIDRVSLKRPGVVKGKAHPEWHRATNYHTDINPHFLPPNLMVQGFVSLLDTDVTQGSLHVIPGWQWDIEKWAADHMDKKRPPHVKLNWFTDESVTRKRTKQLAFKKGDLLIWNSAVIHGSYPNTRSLWRSFVYITYFEANYNDQEMLEARLQSYRTGIAPDKFATGNHIPQVSVSEEQLARYVAPQLTELGRKLLGEVYWPNGAMNDL